MTRQFLALTAAVLLFARAATAQETFYVQIEALPSLNRAEQRVRDYASVLQNVNGFSLGAGWYGVALGPYSRDEAVDVLLRLRQQGRVPRDAYVAEPIEYRSQFWPVGATLTAPLENRAPGVLTENTPPENDTPNVIVPDNETAETTPDQNAETGSGGEETSESAVGTADVIEDIPATGLSGTDSTVNDPEDDSPSIASEDSGTEDSGTGDTITAETAPETLSPRTGETTSIGSEAEETVAEADPTPEPAPEPEPLPEPEPEVVDETPNEARASERLLTRDEKKELQIALKWAGFYRAGIDGAYGRGTRRAMRDWQLANAFEPTGVLTTLQRAELLRQYNAVFDGMNMTLVDEVQAGIQIELPLGVVGFEKYESPFVHFPSTTDLGARVLLISQPGDRNTLFGLYEIMQTLEIVPLDGPRERTNRGFTLTGANDRIISHTEVRLSGDTLKGFTFIWPTGDEERRTRILERMQKSFTAFDGVLDPAALSDGGQSVDLISGLKVRVPRLSRSGFFVDRNGTIVTTIEAVAGCSRVTLDGAHEMRVLRADPDSGIAVLAPETPLAPMRVAQLQTGIPRLQSEVAVSGFSYGGALSAPTLTFGTLQDLRDLAGQEGRKRLDLEALPGDAGGPVLDAGGAVVGMLLPAEEGNRRLPPDVSFAINAESISSVLRAAGVPGQRVTNVASVAPEDLTNMALGMTVLVSCWDS